VSWPKLEVLEAYNATFQASTLRLRAQWASVRGDRRHTGQRIGAEKEQAAFVGSKWVIEKAEPLLSTRRNWTR